jgi:hypothetical protein
MQKTWSLQDTANNFQCFDDAHHKIQSFKLKWKIKYLCKRKIKLNDYVQPNPCNFLEPFFYYREYKLKECVESHDNVTAQCHS